MSVLFSPVRLRGLTLANRIIVSPMCQYSADGDGKPNEWHRMHLPTLAVSGAAAVCIEATAVEPIGRITVGDLGLWDDERERALGPVIAAMRRYSDSAVFIQLAHAGRKASCAHPWHGGTQIGRANGGWQTVGPSAVSHAPGEDPPTPLDAAGMERIRDAFVAAAKRAVRLGIDGIELHCAHGYLLHEFLSPLANRRSDEYGGALENRLRFPLEVFDAIRAAVPSDIPVGVRVSATDWVEAGWDLDQTIAFSVALQRRGVDWIAGSSGGISPDQKIPLRPGYQVPFAAAIREAAGAKTIAVGLITEPQQAEDIVASGQADIVALARGMLYDPRWPWHAAAALGATVAAPPQYWRSQPHGLKGLFGEA